MSESTRETVRRIAALARLEVAPAEELELARQFERILGQFRVLAALDVSGIEAQENPILPADLRRKDEPRPGFTAGKALSAAPARLEDFYRVPKTVGGAE
jgi:aspartyl-tRNA(Asn)/glutamyl-tRNA(Gln) amidotransferase subunit C